MKNSIFSSSSGSLFLSLFVTLSLSISLSILISPHQAFSVVELGQAGHVPPSHDPMIGYQWNLFNNGQSIFSDLDDIHSEKYSSNPRWSMGWKNFDAQMKKDSIVAIIDSGIDSAHPELKGRVLPGKSFADRDANHDTIVDDDFGHGTHLSGIIAAQMDNDEGITGLSNRIKILPLRLHDAEEIQGTRRAKTPFVERVRRAVDFAVQSGVDVINLSQGWPRSENTQEVEASILKAIQAGIVVVAAAGNDHHNVQIFPCAYIGVICVGSHNIDGTPSRFTNHGGHVDLLAPGQWILSLFPSLKTSFLFGIKGYEYKSGSSQAAAEVSGAAGILKGLFPEESGAQIRSRLLSAALSAKAGEPVLFGKLNILAAVTAKQSLTAPVFKKIEQVAVDSASLKFQLPVPLEGQLTQSPQLRSLSTGVNLQLKRNQDGSYFGEGKLSNWNVDNRLTYEVVLGSQKFEHSVILARNIDGLPHEVTDLDPGEIQDLREIKSVTRSGLLGNQTYWAASLTNKQVNLYKWSNGRRVSHLFSEISEPLAGFDLTEWGDGPEYLFGGVQRDDTGQAKAIYFFYLDSNLNLLRTQSLQFEGVVPSSVELSKSELSMGTFAGIKVPVFRDNGLIPQADRNPDPFSYEKNITARRIFYFEPQGNTYITRTLTAAMFQDYLQEHLGPQTEALALLPQSNQDKKLGLIKILLYQGSGILGTHYVAEISDLKDWQKNIRFQRLNTGSNYLARNLPAPAWNIEKGLDVTPEFQGLFSEIAGRSILIDGPELLVNRLIVPRLPEKLVGILKTFSREKNVLSLFETSEFVRAQGTWDGQKIDSKFAVSRSTFLPGFEFRQTAMPILIGKLHNPGVLVDDSFAFSRTVTVYALEGREMKASAGKTFALPENCLNKNPGIAPDGQSVMTFLCKTPNGVKLRHFKL